MTRIQYVNMHMQPQSFADFLCSTQAHALIIQPKRYKQCRQCSMEDLDNVRYLGSLYDGH